MNKYAKLLPLVSVALLSGCIQDEPMNAECDIEYASVSVENPTDIFYHDYDTLQTISTVTDSIGFLVRRTAQVGMLPLTLQATEGARVLIVDGNEEVPFVNGTPLDFSNEQKHRFKVVSQDGGWSRTYEVKVVRDSNFDYDHMYMTFDFEQYSLESGNKYYVWKETDPIATGYWIGNDPMWKNGNPGYKLSVSSAKPEDYPSAPIAGGGPDGSDCVKLVTRDTGAFGRMVNYRLASGSMFIGEFDVANALKDALAATLFGVPFKHRPTRISGWFRYIPGPHFQNRDGVILPDSIDQPDFYAVMYRNQDAEGHEVRLNGADILINPHIVAMARLPHPNHGLTDEWQYVVLDMVYREELDPELLENNGYSFTVSVASSYRGGEFEGCVGNTLYVDAITVECEY